MEKKNTFEFCIITSLILCVMLGSSKKKKQQRQKTVNKSRRSVSGFVQFERQTLVFVIFFFFLTRAEGSQLSSLTKSK